MGRGPGHGRHRGLNTRRGAAPAAPRHALSAAPAGGEQPVEPARGAGHALDAGGQAVAFGAKHRARGAEPVVLPGLTRGGTTAGVEADRTGPDTIARGAPDALEARAPEDVGRRADRAVAGTARCGPAAPPAGERAPHRMGRLA